eukprot:CAMPEP_0198197718 /NCGR_PEP_ID=MMETSP1445-20131203/1268_1 /TAXON_ID=36898 /ORGANISM="Pyramimonas sp., Strain CCMP2087" /LENGTH=617 /DNA_ID=CAMNT_0043867063 /DNA_START=159 /DNA_END=2008 /DNA_ORIENTATION=+
MGNDHDARKLSKKKRKRADNSEHSTKRIRVKAAHKKVRKNCRGLCFQLPPEPPSLEKKSKKKGIAKEKVEFQSEIDLDASASDEQETSGSPRKAVEREGFPKMAPPKARPFIASPKWTGPQPGYHFSMGDLGLGYYFDLIEQTKIQKLQRKESKKTKNAVADAPDAKLEKKKVREDVSVAGEVADQGFPSSFLAYLAAMKHASPMSIQRRCWEGCAEGRDVLVVAPPGSGKTLAYILPAALHASQKLAANGNESDLAGSHPFALVLVPTRELAQQVMASARFVKRMFGVAPAVVYGGTPISDQQTLLVDTKPTLLVATPGRAVNLIETGHLHLSATSFLVLDEADKMLQTGFEDQLNTIRSCLPKRRHVLLLSATFPDTVKESASHWLKKPLCLKAKGPAAPNQSPAVKDADGPDEMVEGADGGDETAEEEAMPELGLSLTVNEVVHVCAEHKKSAKLLKHLDKMAAAAKEQRNQPRCLIFANRVKTVFFVGDLVKRHSFRSAIFHGGQAQAERDRVLKDFKAGKVQVLVATDVAGRGLHIEGLENVLNWDFPSNMQQYIHRVGRTGRNNQAGAAYTFFTRNFAPVAPDLIAHLAARKQFVDPNLKLLAEKAYMDMV